MVSTLLYGPSGIGKSTIGSALAKKESRRHIDTDRIFTGLYGAIGEYIRKYGITAFRIKEGEILEKYLWTCDVVSLGGGTLLLPENQKLADSTGNVITLMTNVETIVPRILGDRHNSRPLVNSEEEIRRLYDSRLYHYISQKIVLNLNGNDSSEEVIRIIQKLQIKTNLLLPIC